MSSDDKQLQENLDGKVFDDEEEKQSPIPQLASPTSSSKSSSRMVSP